MIRNMVTLENALETAMNLPPSELDDFISILEKRRSEKWRKSTAEFYLQLQKELKAGKLKAKDVKDTIEDLHNYLESEDNII